MSEGIREMSGLMTAQALISILFGALRESGPLVLVVLDLGSQKDEATNVPPALPVRDLDDVLRRYGGGASE